MKAPESVLLVEDNQVDQYLARHMLKKRWPEATLQVANDGAEAIALLTGADETLPELILLDINMPGMNGHEFLERWYEDKGRETPVVVMLTSSSQNEDRERASRFCCVKDYLVKPLSVQALTDLAIE